MKRLALALLLPLLLCLAAPPAAASDREHLLKQITGHVAGLAYVAGVAWIALACLALSVWVASLLPRRSERMRLALRRHPVGAFLLGAFNLFFLVLIFLLLAQHPPTRGAAIVPGAAALLVALCGIYAKGLDLGDRVLAAAGRPSTPVLALAVGQPVLVFIAGIPVLGWLLAAYFCASGFGGAMISFFVSPASENAVTENR